MSSNAPPRLGLTGLLSRDDLPAMSTLAQKLGHEVQKLVPVALYFLVASQLVALVQKVALAEHGITGPGLIKAVIVAMVVAKVVLVVDLLPFMNVFEHKPVVWNTTWAALLYFVVTLVLQLAESLTGPLLSTGDLGAALDEAAAETPWPRFWTKQLWIFVLLYNYCLVKELGLVIGRGKLFQVLFRDRVVRPDSRS
jgi:hypothetical protein